MAKLDSLAVAACSYYFLAVAKVWNKYLSNMCILRKYPFRLNFEKWL